MVTSTTCCLFSISWIGRQEPNISTATTASPNLEWETRWCPSFSSTWNGWLLDTCGFPSLGWCCCWRLFPGSRLAVLPRCFQRPNFHLHPFAPKLYVLKCLNPPSSNLQCSFDGRRRDAQVLYILSKGLVMLDHKVGAFGEVWGEDFVLSDARYKGRGTGLSWDMVHIDVTDVGNHGMFFCFPTPWDNQLYSMKRCDEKKGTMQVSWSSGWYGIVLSHRQIHYQQF